jgi:hypothetical protein
MSPVLTGDKTSPVSPQDERLRGLGREGRGQMGLAHSNSIFFIYYSELIPNSIQI